jgi:hypothetical protein
MPREPNEALYIRIIKEGIAPDEPRPVNLRLVAKMFARRPEPDIALVSHARGRIRRRANGGVDRRIRRWAGLK